MTDVVTTLDFHATELGRLTIDHNGIERRLTNVPGEVVKGVVA
ncbi:MAG: hypothetical protein O3A87_09935 [Verrucomicrobia bacterium]|nr:hypothetical protein [Verrucomicrobiota bacterium]MDA1006778.1 hypothetical protein [Verrucomicrobiota bacterium]